MWKVMKDLYTNVKAQVLYAGSLSRKINVSQGTGQDRILAPFMYKVYVNGFLYVLTNHCYAIFINGLRIPSLTFADITCATSFLPQNVHQYLLQIWYQMEIRIQSF